MTSACERPAGMITMVSQEDEHKKQFGKPNNVYLQSSPHLSIRQLKTRKDMVLLQTIFFVEWESSRQLLHEALFDQSVRYLKGKALHVAVVCGGQGILQPPDPWQQPGPGQCIQRHRLIIPAQSLVISSACKQLLEMQVQAVAVRRSS